MTIKDLLEKGKKDRQRKARNKTLKDTAIGAAIGVSVGAAAGVLLAPKSGKETREDIAKGARELPEKAQELVEKTKVKVAEAKEKVNERRLNNKNAADEIAAADEEVKE